MILKYKVATTLGASGVIVFLLIIWLSPPVYDKVANVPDLFKPATISATRLFDCSECKQQVAREVIAKYPELEKILGQADEKFEERKKNCDTDECLYSSEGLVLTEIPRERAGEITKALEDNGAVMHTIAYHGGGHTLRLNINNATYIVGFGFP